MTINNDEINWEIIQEASSIATKLAVRNLSVRNNDFDEIQNELIIYILADTPRSRKLARYIHGDTTKEKINKLVYSVTTDRSWLSGIFHNDQAEANNTLKGCRMVLVEPSVAKDIVKKVFSGDIVESESFSIIADKLTNSMSNHHRAILRDVYSNTSLTKKQIASNHGINRSNIYKIIAKAVKIASREWIPVFEKNPPALPVELF